MYSDEKDMFRDAIFRIFHNDKYITNSQTGKDAKKDWKSHFSAERTGRDYNRPFL
jgi:hypothetical protein